MKNAITTLGPSYYVEVISKDGNKREYTFKDADLLLSRARAFARMEFELENNEALSVNIFLLAEGKKSNVSNSTLPGFSENIRVEQNLVPELKQGNPSRLADMYKDELQRITEETARKRASVFKAIGKMKEAIEDIEEAESLFENDDWLFDWVAAIDKRVDVLATAVRSELGPRKAA